IYFVRQGAVRIYYFKNEIDITESFEFENSFVARAESLFTGKPSRKAIQALEDTSLIAIDSNKLFKLFDTHPDLERLFRKIIEQSYVNTVHRIEGLQFHTAEERYQSLIKETPDILKRIPLKYVSSYLGITQVSLSRIRGLK
ncbi:MAG: Crp/Fnr family transcriptional regulator, partial [Bacteroidetes bacterium]|nr:Crp/Fnr family transcriptional regulator [Bacteroidota bacterium]